MRYLSLGLGSVSGSGVSFFRTAASGVYESGVSRSLFFRVSLRRGGGCRVSPSSSRSLLTSSLPPPPFSLRAAAAAVGSYSPPPPPLSSSFYVCRHTYQYVKSQRSIWVSLFFETGPLTELDLTVLAR